jgi:hypothetical protein
MLRYLSSRFGVALAVLLLAGLTTLAPQAGASEQTALSAQGAQEQVQVRGGNATLALAPGCVHRWYEEHWYAFHVHGQNNCGNRQYVKVIIAFGPDSGCMGLDPGQSFTHSFQFGRFDRLDSC